jgi:hypothetical protein
MRVTPPRSMSGYRHFYGSGHVICADGADIPTGRLTVGCEHSTAFTPGAVRDHYAHAGLGFADVRIIDGEYGPWACGSLVPGLTEAQLRVLRALTLSGDWVPVDGNLELIGVLAVNAGSFPVGREEVVRASALEISPVALRASVHNGVPSKLVASGLVARCLDCQKRRAERHAARQQTVTVDARLDRIERMVAQVEQRTRHLIPTEAAAIREQLRAQTITVTSGGVTVGANGQS